MGVWPETDWPKIIETHRQALKGVLEGLVALAACLGGGPTLPRHLHLSVMRLLRPAESAARRLVILVALRLPMPEVAPPRVAMRVPPPPLPYGVRIVKINLGLAVGPPPPRRVRGLPVAPPSDIPPPLTPPRKGEGVTDVSESPSPLGGGVRGGGSHTSRPNRIRDGGNDRIPRPPVFRLLDPLRRVQLRRYPVRTSVPRIWTPGVTERFRFVPRRFDDAIDATRISRRFAALAAALENLPREALRFLRWQARNAAERAAGHRRRIAPLRFGRPPGQNRRRTHEVHDILAKLHSLADYALGCPDTS